MSPAIGRVICFTTAAAALVALLAACAGPSARSGDSLEPAALGVRPVLAVASAIDATEITDDQRAELLALDCAVDGTGVASPASESILACDDDGEAYLLGPAELGSAQIAEVSAYSHPGASDDDWAVLITLDAEGAERLTELTERLVGHSSEDPRSRLAMVLDGRVISAPTVMAVITDAQISLSGGFTEESAKALAERLDAR